MTTCLHPCAARRALRSEGEAGNTRMAAGRCRAERSGMGQVLGWPLAIGVGLLALPLIYALCTHVWLASGSVTSAAALVVGMTAALAAMMLPGGALLPARHARPTRVGHRPRRRPR